MHKNEFGGKSICVCQLKEMYQGMCLESGYWNTYINCCHWVSSCPDTFHSESLRTLDNVFATACCSVPIDEFLLGINGRNISAVSSSVEPILDMRQMSFTWLSRIEEPSEQNTVRSELYLPPLGCLDSGQKPDLTPHLQRKHFLEQHLKILNYKRLQLKIVKKMNYTLMRQPWKVKPFRTIPAGYSKL